MTFEDAVRKAPCPVTKAYKPGIQALKGEHRSLVTCKDTRRLRGSIDLDTALAGVAEHANAPRWDYGVGRKRRSGGEHSIWVEVHPAATSNVKEVVMKLRWLKKWLRSDAPDLKAMTVQADGIKPFVWLSNKATHINQNSPQARLLAASGLDIPRQKLVLP